MLQNVKHICWATPGKECGRGQHDIPIGIVLTEGCESHFLINEHERHFCVTVILLPLLGSIILSHSVRQMEKTGKDREAMTLTGGTTFVYGVAHFGEMLCVDIN